MSTAIQKLVEERCLGHHIPEGRIRILDWAGFDLSEERIGVLLIHAMWSGPSALSFRIFINAISQVHVLDFDFMITDADTIVPFEFSKIFGIVPQGNGEAIWMKDGKVIHIDKHGLKNVLEVANRIKDMQPQEGDTNNGADQ